jgi:hypothetical protein
MPLMFGEGSGNTFIRLRDEIDRRLKKEEGDPKCKAIKDLLLYQKRRKEARMAAEAAGVVETKAAESKAKLKAEEEKLARLQDLILKRNSDRSEREKKEEAMRRANAAELAAKERAIEQNMQADEQARLIKRKFSFPWHQSRTWKVR